MTTVVLIIHLMIAAALVAVILFQRSEGGALGIGGGGGGFMSGRGAANLLTRTTSILGAAFSQPVLFSPSLQTAPSRPVLFWMALERRRRLNQARRSPRRERQRHRRGRVFWTS